jgi:hypothetical protein
MATTQKCGTTIIEYDKGCSYSCSCPANKSCSWSVTCGGTTIATGTGLVNHPHKVSSVTIGGGTPAMCAMNLQRLWNRPVIVPPKLRAQKVRKRTLKGGPEEVAKALGLQLGPRRKRVR